MAKLDRFDTLQHEINNRSESIETGCKKRLVTIPPHIKAKFDLVDANKQAVINQLVWEAPNHSREMPKSYIEAPSFFNNKEASEKARSLINNFTQSYLS